MYLKAMILYSSIFLIVDCLSFYFEFPFSMEKEIGLKEVVKLLLKTFFVGGVFSLVLVSIHLKYLSIMGLDLNSKSDLSPIKQKKLTLNISFGELYNLVNSFKDLKAVVNTKEGFIFLKPTFDIPFYGENISLKYTKKKENEPAEIIIQSNSKNKFAIIDFGSNYSNVKEIEKRIAYTIFSSENLVSTVQTDHSDQYSLKTDLFSPN